jgi:hypothetical protein
MIGYYISPPPLREPKKRGRNKVHCQRFAFQEPVTWGEPAEVIHLDDQYWGQVRIDYWNYLHERKGTDVLCDVNIFRSYGSVAKWFPLRVRLVTAFYAGGKTQERTVKHPPTNWQLPPTPS